MARRAFPEQPTPRRKDTMTVVGIDAHKKSHTCVAVDSGGAKLAEKTVAATSVGHSQALRWAHSDLVRMSPGALRTCAP